MRLERDRLQVPLGAAVDELVGPVYYRALFADGVIDDELLDSIVSGLVD
jgi:hypothetical protein